MKETFELMKAFEQRNNISIAFHAYSDGSLSVVEFWNEEVLHESNSEEELKDFLKNTEYERAKNGLCYSPVRIKSNV